MKPRRLSNRMIASATLLVVGLASIAVAVLPLSSVSSRLGDEIAPSLCFLGITLLGAGMLCPFRRTIYGTAAGFVVAVYLLVPRVQISGDANETFKNVAAELDAQSTDGSDASGSTRRPIWAQLPDSAQSKMVNDLRSSLGLSDMVKRVGDGKIDSKKIGVIAAILRNTNEVEIHQMRGSQKNVVYLSPDGHSEAVFDVNHKLVKDGINDGSYNYFHPQKDALRHFSFDIAPWLLFGQSLNDPTTRTERVKAYSADLYNGLFRALGEPPTKVDDLDLKEPGSAEAIAIFLIAAERGKAQGVFRVVGLREKKSEREVAALVRNLEGGLQLLCSSEKNEVATRD